MLDTKITSYSRKYWHMNNTQAIEMCQPKSDWCLIK